MFDEKNDLGTISFSAPLIGNIVKHAVAEMGGKLSLSGLKGKTPRGATKPNADDLSFLKLFAEDDSIDITIYVVIRFGASIKQTAAALDALIRAEVPKITGLRLNRLTLSITGVRAKNISRRSIEVTSYAE